MNRYQEKYIDEYSKVIEIFLKEIGDSSINTSGLLAPHIPMCGPLYGEKLPKVAIIGEATRGWENLDDFLINAKVNPTKIVENTDWVFKEHTFTKWTNNFGKTFWDTAFKILAEAHGERDWKNLKNKNRTDILDSFLWCNTNSIEDFNITAKHQGAEYASWEKVKEISRRTLDKYELIEDIFSPDITVIMNWDIDPNYLNINWDLLENHLAVGHTEKSSIIYRMAHPAWLNTHNEYESVLNALFDSINNKC